MLYPLKFEPIYKERVWGGEKLRMRYDRIYPADKRIGESWEISGLQDDVSVVSNGSLAGNELNELIEIYMGDLVGERVYNRYGEEFPVLVKLLDTKELLSIQVHPDNALAAQRHGAYGKTEMWYVMEADPGSYFYLGFNRDLSQQEFLQRVAEHTLTEVMNRFEPKVGEIFFVPAGTIHSIGPGLVIVEVQQTSDITYRVYDWDRKESSGQSRELHTELALDALDYSRYEDPTLPCPKEKNHAAPVKHCADFVTNLIQLDGRMERDYLNLDSFVIYVCLQGEVIVECEGGAESLMDTETVLIPAEMETVRLTGKGKILEIYMPQ
ncbi:MAG: class I mannose-6-phosphate isomerase [Rikenellaceae bacterium]|jgi:mannose-6-phosphate isomerase|nr:class I mannose-6-phosphate isomerase [Rikenellaceae bacterium]